MRSLVFSVRNRVRHQERIFARRRPDCLHHRLEEGRRILQHGQNRLRRREGPGPRLDQRARLRRSWNRTNEDGFRKFPVPFKLAFKFLFKDQIPTSVSQIFLFSPKPVSTKKARDI